MSVKLEGNKYIIHHDSSRFDVGVFTAEFDNLIKRLNSNAEHSARIALFIDFVVFSL